MEVAPRMEVGPVVRMAIPDVAAPMEARRYAKAAAMDREPAAPESATMKGTATAVKSAAAEATSVKSAAAEAAAATTEAGGTAAVTNLGRQTVRCVFGG
jgi:hypothetical protein